MQCAQVEELLCDHHEGLLQGSEQRALETHLAACADCRDLAAALDDVLAVLRRPADAVEPSAGLAQRAARAALRAGRAGGGRQWSWQPPSWVHALAASVAVASTVTILALQGLTGAPGERPRFGQHAVNAGVYLLERKDRLVEDLRLLRVVLATAFEARVDRVNDRVDDYRRLLDRRRDATGGRKESDAGTQPLRAAQHLRTSASPRT